MAHILGDWKVNEPITPVEANAWDGAITKSNSAISSGDYTRALGSATTTGTGAALTALVAGFTLSDMAGVNIKLHTDMAASATLNISGTGAKPMYMVNGLPNSATFKAGTVVNVVYNATNDRWYITGGAAGGIPGGTTAGTATALTVTTTEDYQSNDITGLYIKLHTDIGNAPTISVNGRTSRGIYYANGQALLTGAAVNGAILHLVYNATQQRFYAFGVSNVTAKTLISTRLKSEKWTGNGTKTVFDFINGTYQLGGERILMVTVGGQWQEQGVAWSETSPTSITFTTAPPNGLLVYAKYIENLYGDSIDAGTW